MAWAWAAASQIGTSHIRNGSDCQDAHRCFEKDGVLVAIVSDGAGSASEGRRGAVTVCRTMAGLLSASLDRGMPSDDDLHGMIDDTRDAIAHIARTRGLVPRDFAATLVAVIAGEDETVALHIGDGGAAGSTNGEWSTLTWPESGDFAGTTFFVTDDMGARLRIKRFPTRCEALGVLSDGLERLALDFMSEKPFAPFFAGVMRPLARVDENGRSSEISEKLKAFLGSETVNSRTDDDKTLIVARRL